MKFVYLRYVPRRIVAEAWSKNLTTVERAMSSEVRKPLTVAKSPGDIRDIRLVDCYTAFLKWGIPAKFTPLLFMLDDCDNPSDIEEIGITEFLKHFGVYVRKITLVNYIPEWYSEKR